MYAKKFSPIDFPWLSDDPDSACCMCPDSFRDNCTPVDYCPQHGDEPDFSMCHDQDAGRRWRIEQGDVCPTCFSGKPEVFRMVGCGFKCDDIGQWHAKQRRVTTGS